MLDDNDLNNIRAIVRSELAATKPQPAASAPAPGEIVRFGRDKGKLLADVADLGWYRDAIAKSIADPSKERWLSDDTQTLRAIDAEIARRSGGSLPPPAFEAPPFDEDPLPF